MKIFKALLTLIFILFLFTGCAVIKIQSATSENQPYYLNHKSGDEIQIKKPVTLDFYFWGLLPTKRTIYIEDYYQGEGLTRGSNVEVKFKRSFMSYFYSIATLGVYYPVDLQFSLYAKKSDSKDFQFEHPILDGEVVTP